MFTLSKAMFQYSCLRFLTISFLIPFEKLLSQYQIISLVLRLFVQLYNGDCMTKEFVKKVIYFHHSFLNLHVYTFRNI